MSQELERSTVTEEELTRIEEQIQTRLLGRVRDFHLVVRDQRLVLRGLAHTYYAKQLALQAARETTCVPIRANEIEVTERSREYRWRVDMMSTFVSARSASMDTTRSRVHSPTAGDVMNRALLVVPRQMLVRETARLIDRARASEAVVVDEQGRCVGMVCPADISRWIGAGCPEAVIGPILSCPYQVGERLPTGAEGVICILAHGSCPYQVQQPTTGGRHTDLCMRQGSQQPSFESVPCYVTTEVITVGPETLLPELIQQFLDTRADRIIVRDEVDRPIGVISAADVLTAVAGAGDCGRGLRDPANKEYASRAAGPADGVARPPSGCRND